MTSVDPTAVPAPPILHEPVGPARPLPPAPRVAPDDLLQPDPRRKSGRLSRVRAWMVVLPVDAALLTAPALWAPQQWRAHLTMALLGPLLLTGGARYRARLT